MCLSKWEIRRETDKPKSNVSNEIWNSYTCLWSLTVQLLRGRRSVQLQNEKKGVELFNLLTLIIANCDNSSYSAFMAFLCQGSENPPYFGLITPRCSQRLLPTFSFVFYRSPEPGPVERCHYPQTQYLRQVEFLFPAVGKKPNALLVNIPPVNICQGSGGDLGPPRSHPGCCGWRLCFMPRSSGWEKVTAQSGMGDWDRSSAKQADGGIQLKMCRTPHASRRRIKQVISKVLQRTRNVSVLHFYPSLKMPTAGFFRKN